MPRTIARWLRLILYGFLGAGSPEAGEEQGWWVMTLIEILESRKEALNVEQVAEILGISKMKVYHLCAAGLLPAFRVGEAIRFDPQDLADWLHVSACC